MIIVSLRGLGAQEAILASEEDEAQSIDEEAEAEDPTVIAMAHEIEVAGGQRQLANFLDGVYQSAGRVAIDELLITPTADERLNASMLVRWYGPIANEDDEEGEDG